MSQTPLTFSVQVTPDAATPGKWISAAFRLPGARFLAAYRAQGPLVATGTISDGKLALSALEGDLAFVSIEVPDDLVPQTTLDEQKFSLEQEKARNDEINRRHTFVWSVGSALLTAAVTLGVAYLNRESNAKPGGSGPAPDAVEACRASLKRLPLLARTTGQTVQNLSEAIDRHEADCDEVLVKVLGSK